MKKLIPILSVLLLWTVVCGPWTAYAAVPHLIAYQGRLTDSAGIPLDGSYSITFRIYNAEVAGNLLWQETHSNTTVTDGIFDVLLGSVTTLDLPFDIQYFLAIQVAGDPEMTPRQQIASVGYAYKAEKAEQADSATNANTATNADTVDGIHASSTPAANRLVALDTNAKLPNSVLNDSASTQFGLWASKSANTVYQALTDGFVVVYLTGDSNNYGNSVGYTDSSNPPTTIRCGAYHPPSLIKLSYTMPVKKDDYWKVAWVSVTGRPTHTIYWIPLKFSRE